MTRCLSERRLLSLQAREGTPAERAHLQLCAGCAERYDALLEDLALIGAALRSPPRRMPSPHALSLRAPRWAFAVGGVLIVGIVVGSWLQRPAVVQLAARPTNVVALAEEVSNALFATDTDLVTATAPGIDVGDVQAALSGRWPCATGRSLDAQCDDELSALSSQFWD